jgi:hypothetical protein
VHLSTFRRERWFRDRGVATESSSVSRWFDALPEGRLARVPRDDRWPDRRRWSDVVAGSRRSEWMEIDFPGLIAARCD